VVDHAAVPLIEGARAAAGRAYPRREPAKPAMGAPRTPTRGRWVRTTCSCSRTRKQQAGCSWPGAARSAGDRGAGPAPRQRAHHPVAPQPRAVPAGHRRPCLGAAPGTLAAGRPATATVRDVPGPGASEGGRRRAWNVLADPTTCASGNPATPCPAARPLRDADERCAGLCTGK
jgi:hypothetical protein